jgi:hypothetical protein
VAKAEAEVGENARNFGRCRTDVMTLTREFTA